MSQERTYQIERFYFGNLIQNGEPVGKPGIIGSSAGVKIEQVQECLRIARVKPPDISQTTPEMPSALGYFRSASGDYIVVKSQRTPEGFPQLLYLLVPEAALRWLVGNYTLFESLGYQEMRIFEQPAPNMPPLILEDPHPLPDEDQINLLYDLFYFCGDNIKNIEGILAALIHRKPIAILNSPPVLQTRITMIEGLLALLPAPARVGMTWVTQTPFATDTAAQLSFVSSPKNVDDFLVYDWEARQIIGEAPKDPYSKFIAAQLRLDAALVLETTISIARTAVWRAMRKESLADALHFASRRAAIDSAVMNNQPADRETVAAILRQDPTLSDEMRLAYAEHLLAFTLALGDGLEHSYVIPVVGASDRPVAEMAYNKLRSVAEGNNPLQVIDIIESWLTNVPQASVIPWNQVAYIAAVNHLDDLLQEGKTSAVIDFLKRTQSMNRALHMENAVPQMIGIAQPTAAYDAELANAIFLLALEYLVVQDIQHLLDDAQFVGQLPQHVQHALFFLQPQPRANPPADLLLGAAADFEAQYRMLVIGRLAELAVFLERENLIDTRILEGLLRASQSGYAARFAGLMQHLADKYSHPRMLQELDAKALELLPHLYFSIQRHEMGIRLLEHYQNKIYGAERLPEFVDLMGHVFLKTSLPLETLEQVFALMEHSKLRPEPRTRAYTAVLIAAEWGYAYKNLARRLTIMLYNDPILIEAIGIENTLELLAYHIAAKDRVSIMETSTVLLEVALSMGKKGVNLVMKIGEMLLPNAEMEETGVDVLRQYIRMADSDYAAQLPAYFQKQFGGNTGKKLQATYVLRLALGGQSLMEFAEALDLTAALLVDLAIPYHETKEIPPKHRIRRSLDSMTGGLDDSGWAVVGKNIAFLARTVFELGRRQVGQSRELENALMRNQSVPLTPLDFLTFMGGRYANAKHAALNLEKEEMAHVFGNRSAAMLLQETNLAVSFLSNLMQAFPLDRPPRIELAAFNEEMDNLWKALSLYNQRQIQPTLATESQYLTQVITRMAGRVKENIFKNKRLYTGEHEPENTIEALLWISGYFNRTHLR